MRSAAASRQTAHLAPRYRTTGPRRPRAPVTGPLVACSGCGARKRKPLETRFAGTVLPPSGVLTRVERAQPVCVYCYVQLETYGRTRLDQDDAVAPR